MDIVRRQPTGDPRDPIVILRYVDPSVRRPHHIERKRHPSDQERNSIIRAEAELRVLDIIFDHLELSDVARTRIDNAMLVIYRALQLKRPGLGLDQPDGFFNGR